MFEIEKKYPLSSAEESILLPRNLLGLGYELEAREKTRTIYLKSNSINKELLRLVVIKTTNENDEFKSCPDVYILGKKWLEEGKRREQEEHVSRLMAETLVNLAGDYREIYKERDVWRYKKFDKTGLDKVKVDIDRTQGYGMFVELEVEVDSIENVLTAENLIEETRHKLHILSEEENRSYFEMVMERKSNLIEW